ncbi:MAG: hypothetical protein ABIR92_01355, partial [Gemmatimonadaceae bacterium]
LGDSYRPTSDMQIQYGVRVDGNRFRTPPEANTSLAAALGLDNTALPSRIYVSPRIGFSWTYGQSEQLAIGSGFARTPRAVVRGGVGYFQNTPSAQIASGALFNTGRSNGSQQVICVGSAVPVPNWVAYLNDSSLIPSACADGATTSGFGSASPSVTLFDADFAAQRSLRSNLNWSGALAQRLGATVDVTLSRNRQQPGVFDANFVGAAQFTLDDEGGRPVFAPASTIVPSTGSIAPGQSRFTPAFGSVLVQRSDLAGVSRQVSVSLQPLSFSSRYSWSLTYVNASVTDEVFGFASTAGDPRLVDRSRSAMDSRHQLQYSVAWNFFDWVPVSFSGSVRSGRPYTPLVGGDVNGDGFNNDRAFVSQAALTALASEGARQCLESQTGAVAGRNSCQGPRTTTSNLTIAFNAMKFRLPQRVNLSLFVNNAFGAADLLVHGENDRRGWGQAAMPDQTLLFVRGFDATTNRFRYEINPRFGATDPNRTINRNPVVVTAQVKLDVGYTRERQLLTQSLDRGRSRAGAKTTEQDMRSMGVALLPPNPIAMILGQSDSLRLTRIQADSLATLNRKYAIAYESIWLPVGKYLSSLPAEYDSRLAYQRYRTARQSSIDMLAGLAPVVRALLTPEQIRKLPTQVTTSLDTRYLASIRSSTAGGAAVGVMGMLAQMGWTGGTVDPNASAVFIHR